jgi:hypothetical protein
MLIDSRYNINFQNFRKTLSVKTTHYEYRPVKCRFKDKVIILFTCILGFVSGNIVNAMRKVKK